MTNSSFVRVGVRVGYFIQPNGCWEWGGARDKEGYGIWIVPGTKGSRAHRVLYERLARTIPPGIRLDHLCRNRACVNPTHLEEVTDRENILRGKGVAAQKAKQTHCINGHEFNEENTYHRPDRPKGRGRQCRICYTLAVKKRRNVKSS